MKYKAKLVDDFIPVAFDPKKEFGSLRAPVKVTLNGYTFRSTIFSMRGVVGVPLRKSHRDAAGVKGTETLSIEMVLDTEKREVLPPKDFVAALKDAGVWERWQGLSFTAQKEDIEALQGAKKAETRARRLTAIVQRLRK